MRQRCRLVQAEAPFVGIRNEGNAWVLEEHIRLVEPQRRSLIGHVCEVDQLALIRQLAQNSRLADARKVLRGDFHDSAKNTVAGAEYAAAGIAERAGLDDR